MSAPSEDFRTEDVEPTLDDLLGEFSDQELRDRGMAFAAKYLMCRTLEDYGRNADLDPVQDKLRILFPINNSLDNIILGQEIYDSFLWASVELPKVLAARRSDAYQIRAMLKGFGINLDKITNRE